jgi:hypothetical protein
MITKQKYIIQCREMRGVDTFIVETMIELLSTLDRYMKEFGPVDLLYRVE